MKAIVAYYITTTIYDKRNKEERERERERERKNRSVQIRG